MVWNIISVAFSVIALAVSGGTFYMTFLRSKVRLHTEPARQYGYSGTRLFFDNRGETSAVITELRAVSPRGLEIGVRRPAPPNPERPWEPGDDLEPLWGKSVEMNVTVTPGKQGHFDFEARVANADKRCTVSVVIDETKGWNERRTIGVVRSSLIQIEK